MHTSRVIFLLIEAVLADCASAATLHATVRLPDGSAIGDAVVIAVPANAAAARRAPPATPEVIEQVNFEFEPRVKPIQVGTTVRFPNNDKGRHHVYSFSPAKRFELPLYAPGAPAAPVLFDAPGAVVLGCNIHDWMVGYVYVSESPFFAKSGPDGAARIADLPPGRYTVRVWHPLLEGPESATAREVVLEGDRSPELSWNLRLRPDVRPRRPAPKPAAAAAPAIHH